MTIERPDLFLKSQDAEILLPDLLSRELSEREILFLRSFNLSVTNEVQTDIPAAGNTFSEQVIRFSFSIPGRPKWEAEFTGRVQIDFSRWDRRQEITAIEVKFAPESENSKTWRYQRNPENPIYDKGTSVTYKKPGGAPGNMFAYRRVKFLKDEGIIFDENNQPVIEGTQQILEAHEQAMVICAYVAQQVATQTALPQ